MDIEGISEAYAAKLKGVGIGTVEALIEVCALPNARATVAERTGIPEKRILEWANHADLMRIDGVGSEYASSEGSGRGHDHGAVAPHRAQSAREAEGGQRGQKAGPTPAERPMSGNLDRRGQGSAQDSDVLTGPRKG
jgi:hypothetical protein